MPEQEKPKIYQIRCFYFCLEIQLWRLTQNSLALRLASPDLWTIHLLSS